MTTLFDSDLAEYEYIQEQKQNENKKEGAKQ